MVNDRGSILKLDDLVKQVRKYRDGAKKILDKTIYKHWPIEIIILLGKPPPEYNDAIGTGPTGVAATLASVDARIVFYDDLLSAANQAYGDYLDEHVKIDRLWGVFGAIDNFVPPPPVDQRLVSAKKAIVAKPSATKAKL